MDRENIAVRLELIASKAKLLAEDVRRNKLWEGDLYRGISEISSEINRALQDARTDR